MLITDCSVIEQRFRYGRWYSVLDKPFWDKKVIPKAHYVWLKGNPSFKTVPAGYVFHHLDCDPQNNDISNLVIMQKHHHRSYHLKNRTIDVKANVKLTDHDLKRKEYWEYNPVTEPKYYKFSDDRWFVQFVEIIEGKRKLTKVTRFMGEVVRTEETAIKLRDGLVAYYKELQAKYE